MSNVAGKAYGMNVFTPMRPGVTWINKLIFMASRALPGTLGGLLGLSLIHFARWAIIKRDAWPQRGQGPQPLLNDYMLFVSNFNGTWDQYIDAFADGIPGGLDLFWYSSTKYPNSIPVTPFKTYIRANQIDTSYYYNATPGSGQRDIKCALKVSAALLAVDPNADDATLAAAFLQVLAQTQSCLGAPGYAPIASCDTTIAGIHSAEAVRKRWGPHGEGAPPAVHVLHAVAPDTVVASAVDDGAIKSVRAAIDAITPGSIRTDDLPELKPTRVYQPPVIVDGALTQESGPGPHAPSEKPDA